MGIVVTAMGVTLRFPINVIQVAAGLFLLSMGVIHFVIRQKGQPTDFILRPDSTKNKNTERKTS